MIIVMGPLLILGITIFLVYNKIIRKNKEIKQYGGRNWIKIIVIVNICVICFFRFIFPGVTSYATFTICFYISVLINIVTIILVFSKKILDKKVIVNCIIIIYFLLMIGLPIYKFEDHKHVFDNTRTFRNNGIDWPIEEIIEYTDYYNCYGVKLYTN